ncbi:MAG: hypothetical protein SGPRY_003348 [Prymnesium sp.]
MPAGGEGSRAAGKRQVRPNMARSDFGYEERSRAPAKPIKKPKRAEDEDEPASANGADGGAARPARNEKEARNLTVDFTKLDMATLKRYKRHYRLKTRQNVTKTELAMAVAKHFASQTVDEADTISLFMYSARGGSLQYGAWQHPKHASHSRPSEPTAELLLLLAALPCHPVSACKKVRRS